MSRQSKKYAGCLFAEEVGLDGVAIGAIFKLGNAYPVTMNMGVNSNKMVSALCDTPGQTIEVRNELDSISGSVTLYQYGAAEIGYAVGATPVAMTEAAGTIASTDATAPAAGDWLEVGYKNLTGFVLTNAAGDVTYAKDVDYQFNEYLGVWTIIAGGSITAGDALKYTGAYAAESGYRLDVGTQLNKYLRIFGTLRELKTGNRVAFNAKCVSLTSKDGFTVISEPKTEFETLSFDMEFITPAGQTSPVTIEGMTKE